MKCDQCMHSAQQVTSKLHFCVSCVAWQTLRDHVVSPCRRCRCHTYRLRSITFEGIHWFHSNFVELYITVKYRSSLILVIIRQILAELCSFFDLDFVVCFRSITFEGMHWFHFNFAEFYFIVKYRSSSILVIIRQILTVMALFRLSFYWCVDIGFCSITFAGMHWFYWKFAEGYIIIKYRSNSILVIIHKMLAVIALFQLSFCFGGKIQDIASPQ